LAPESSAAEVEFLHDEEEQAKMGGWRDLKIHWVRRLVIIGSGLAVHRHSGIRIIPTNRATAGTGAIASIQRQTPGCSPQTLPMTALMANARAALMTDRQLVAAGDGTAPLERHLPAKHRFRW
jgi:hypothetical protein